MLLNPEQRNKLDPADDSLFYSYPRFVNHVDDKFIEQLTQLYRERLKADTRILDLMSSWVSHLPPEMSFSHVEGHGMNAEELAKNPRLDHYFVQNLNTNQKLPLADADFDAVLCTVSIQYIQYPQEVFAELYRILKPQGIVIISFSNRMFYQKAIAAWRDGSATSRVELVYKYFQAVPGFSKPEVVYNQSVANNFLQLLGMSAADPFYAVIATKQ